jgi:preprotein translocase subunit SecF
MLNIIGNRFKLLLAGIAALLVSVILLVIFGLKPGLEFTSGTMFTLRFEDQTELSVAEVRSAMNDLGYANAVVQSTSRGDFQIRISLAENDEVSQIENSLAEKYGKVTREGITKVEPTISHQTVRATVIAIIAASIGMLLYITFAFRRMPNPFQYGACAIITLIWDLTMVIGTFALIAGIADWEINLMFITGLLSVIGYSVNDKIVMFDRIRENKRRSVSTNFSTLANVSVVESINRSLLTSVSTMLAVLALMFFVGSSIKTFLMVLLLGIIYGTYSSIFFCVPFLTVWENREWGKIFSFGK